MNRPVRLWAGFSVWGFLAAGVCAGCGASPAAPTVPVLPSETTPAGAEAPPPKAADAGQPAAGSSAGSPALPQAGMPPMASAGAAAPSSTGGAGAAAPSSNAAAGSGAIREGADTGHGKGGASQSDGKLEAFIEVTEIPVGAEAHRCVVVELPNSEPVWVETLHATLGNGSHHMIIDRRRAEDTLMPDAELCGPTMGGDASRLLIAQQHDTLLELPPNVGFLLEPKQRLFLQLHYINVTEKPMTIKGNIALNLFAQDAKPIEAQSTFTGSTSINLAPRQPGTSTHFQKLPAEQPWHVFAMTSHTHQLGVHSTIERVAALDAAETTPLHESRDWSEPPLTVFEEPLVFDGSDGLRLTCRYMNTTDRTVTFGTAVDSEMCFMWIYYFVNEASTQ
jgi:hypothetical protein